MRNQLLAAGAALVLSHANASSADAAVPPGQLDMSTERVVVFKDGYGLFTKVATSTADKDGRVWTTKVPDAAILGSFWALAEGNKIVAMRAEWDEQKELRKTEGAALTTLEILRANPGKSVTLVYGYEKEKETYAGTLVEVLETMPAPTPTPEHVTPGAPGETVRRIEPLGGQLLVLDTGDRGRVVLPIAGIRTVSGKDLVTKITRTEEVITRTKRLSFDMGKDAAGKSVKLRVFYFTPGVRWIPTYRVGGELDKGSADIALQGEILNEEEDIVDAAIDLVVGVPNFRFKGTISPLSLEKVMQNALAQAAPQLMGQAYMGNDFSNASFRSRAGEFNNASPANSTVVGDGTLTEPELPAELTAAAAQDHFVYSVKSFSLKKGGRATVPLWQTSAPVRHLYTLDLNVQRSGEGYTKYASMGGSYSRSPMRMEKNDVWHQLELGNPGSVPWTTGAAFVTSGSMPVAQELLGYTPPGAKTLLPLTIAIDIRGEYEESEIDRTTSARKWNGDMYALLKKKGTVKVKNHRKEKATVRVHVGVGGRADSATSGGKIKLDEYRPSDWNGYGALNNHSDVTWEVTLAPGEEKDLSYTFSFYQR